MMQKKNLKKFPLPTISFLIQTKKHGMILLEWKELLTTEQTIQTLESLEITTSCDDDSIDNYLNDGWNVISKTTEEITCSWKSIKAYKNCDLDRDKGCRITVPDEKGIETKYILEKNNK